LDLLLRTGREVVITSTIQNEVSSKPSQFEIDRRIDAWINANEGHGLIVDRDPSNPAAVPGSHNGELSIINYVSRYPGDVRVVSGDADWINNGVPSTNLAAGRDLAGTSGANLTTTEFVNDLLLSGNITPLQHWRAVSDIDKTGDIVGAQSAIMLRPFDEVPLTIEDQSGGIGKIVYMGVAVFRFDSHGFPVEVTPWNGFLHIPQQKIMPLDYSEETGFSGASSLAYANTEGPRGEIQLTANDTADKAALAAVGVAFDPSTGFIKASVIRDDNSTTLRTDRPDGASTVTNKTADPAAAYASFTDRYDAAQHLIEQTVHKIDGTTSSSAVSTSSAQSWLNDALTYDQFGRVAAETLINRDNTTVTRVNDLAGTQSFATQISVFDQANRLTLQDTFNDDGSVVQLGFDPGNQNPNFDHFVTTFNSFLQRTGETDTYDDHGHADFLFDTTGQAWASQVSVYNPAGQVTRTEVAADDGSATVNIYDPAHIHPDYDHAVGHFDSQGHETDEIDTFDNGGRNELRWDTTGQQPWTEQVRQFDSSNRETVRDEFNDNHTTTQYGFDLAGAANWSSYVAHFDAQGHETDARYEFDAGPNAGGHADLVFNSSNSNLYTESDYNAANQLTGTATGNGATGEVFNEYTPADYSGYEDFGGDFDFGFDGPVVLDLDGNGVTLALSGASGATFDMDGQPGREHTAWAGSNDGILAIDLGAGGMAGANGVIDQTKEIVFTQWAAGTTSDMAALRQAFDTNHNNQLDPGDARWGEFRVWKDANQDGTTDPGELFTLAALGIAAINLVPTAGPGVLADGSAINGLATYARTNGTTGFTGDVSLAMDLGIALGGADARALVSARPNPDGSITTEVDQYDLAGSFVDEHITTVSSDRTHIDVQTDSDGDGIIDTDLTTIIHADQTRLIDEKLFGIDGALLGETQVGDSGNDVLAGGSANDVLRGQAGNDTLTGGPGNDLLIGGTGTDTAAYSAPAGSYAVFSYNGTVAVLTHGAEGNDRLLGVENIQFANVTVAATTAAAFDGWEYLASNADLIAAVGANPQAAFDHYVDAGFAAGRATNSFDAVEYLASNGDLLYAFGLNIAVAEQHYVTNGFNEHRATTSFDPVEYLASNTDLIGAFGFNTAAAEQHYVTNGFNEHRATTSFDPVEYLASNTDLISAFGFNTAAAEQHYVTNGFNEHRATNSFDAPEYLASNIDLIHAFGLNLAAAEQHYVTNGFNEHRATNSFDPLEYLASNADLIHFFGLDPAAAYQHFLHYGFNEGRTTASFNAAQYLANYADLSSAFGNNLIAARQHYITNGFDEGRTDQAPVINGDGGDNTLVARNGATMTGGAGADTFVFNASLLTPATITDFTVGSDHLQISASGFGHGLSAGSTAPLVTAATASSANHAGPDGYFIFDNASDLWWDPSGGSGADAIAQAKLTGVASLHASDFLLV
jgi:hypothetical protein